MGSEQIARRESETPSGTSSLEHRAHASAERGRRETGPRTGGREGSMGACVRACALAYLVEQCSAKIVAHESVGHEEDFAQTSEVLKAGTQHTEQQRARSKAPATNKQKQTNKNWSLSIQPHGTAQTPPLVWPTHPASR